MNTVCRKFAVLFCCEPFVPVSNCNSTLFEWSRKLAEGKRNPLISKGSDVYTRQRRRGRVVEGAPLLRVFNRSFTLKFPQIFQHFINLQTVSGTGVCRFLAFFAFPSLTELEVR